ncbi:hypothetical protein ME806_10170 [Lactobacillus delbrueckii]|nr:hypothetical protein ME806_10170 [Lactobacillus delbrueckii]
MAVFILISLLLLSLYQLFAQIYVLSYTMPVNFVKLYTNLEREEIAWKSWEKRAKKGPAFSKSRLQAFVELFY